MCTYIYLNKYRYVIYYIPKGNIKVVCNMHMNVIPEGIINYNLLHNYYVLCSILLLLLYFNFKNFNI